MLRDPETLRGLLIQEIVLDYRNDIKESIVCGNEGGKHPMSFVLLAKTGEHSMDVRGHGNDEDIAFLIGGFLDKNPDILKILLHRKMAEVLSHKMMEDAKDPGGKSH